MDWLRAIWTLLIFLGFTGCSVEVMELTEEERERIEAIAKSEDSEGDLDFDDESELAEFGVEDSLQLEDETEQEINETDPTEEEAPKIIKSKVIGNRAKPSKPKRKDSKGYQQQGEWENSELLGYKETYSRISDDPDAQVTYTANLSGLRYCLSAYRVTDPDFTDSAQFDVFEGDSEEPIGTHFVAFDLANDQSGWHPLGVYSLDEAGSLTVSMSRADDSNSGSLSADEIRFKYVKDGFDCGGRISKKIKNGGMIDNREKKMAGYREFGEWETSSTLGYKDSLSRQSSDPNAYATYSFELTDDKTLCLQTYRITDSSSSDRTKYTITGADGEYTYDTHIIEHNLSESKTGWYTFGKYDLQLSDNPIVITVEAESNFDNGGLLRADAIRWKKPKKNGKCPKK